MNRRKFLAVAAAAPLVAPAAIAAAAEELPAGTPILAGIDVASGPDVTVIESWINNGATWSYRITAGDLELFSGTAPAPFVRCVPWRNPDLIVEEG
jgi:hypothetical protein